MLDLFPLVPREIWNACRPKLLAELAQSLSIDERNCWVFRSQRNRVNGECRTRDNPRVGTGIVKLPSDHFLNCLVANYAGPAFGLDGDLVAVLGENQINSLICAPCVSETP